MSEDGQSVVNSETSETTTAGGRRRRRTPRISTAFHLAHPAPTLVNQKQKLLHVPPKLLLQLQQLSAGSRPKPVIDVLPSSGIIPRSLKKFHRMFRSRCELGVNDVMVVRSEDYHVPLRESPGTQDSDDEALSGREVVAVICQIAKADDGSQAEVTLKDGPVWTASPLPKGSFEFTSTDPAGQQHTARWVRRALPGNPDLAGGPPEYKYTFSMIDPNSRRHPIMATITQSTLDIPDFYTSVSKTTGKKSRRASLVSTVPEQPEVLQADDDLHAERTTHTVDEGTKTLIQVTGIWLALRQNWSPYFSYNDSFGGTQTASRIASQGRSRSLSLSPDGSKASPGTALFPDCGQVAVGSIRKVQRMNSSKCRGSPDSSQNQISPPPKRARSTGPAFMQRATGRTSVPVSDSEGEAAMPLSQSDLAAHRMSMPVLGPPNPLQTAPDTPTKSRRRRTTIFPSTKSKKEQPPF